MIYKRVKEFKKKYSGTIAFRLKKHCDVIKLHLNPDEKVLYAFCGQKNSKFYEIFFSCVVVLTNQRILIGQKRLLWGYFYTTITPDMFNDLSISAGLIWGSVTIDTAKEVVVISNISKKALDEIETAITSYMMKEKQKYNINKEKRLEE